MYDSCVRPIIEYFSGIWGYDDFDELHKLYLKAIRYYLGVPRNACNVGITSLMVWKPPLINNFVNMCRLYNKLVKMED